MKQKQQSSLRTYISKSYLALIIIAAVMIISLGLFLVGFIVLDGTLQLVFEIVGGSLLLLSLIGVFVLFILSSEKQYNLFYNTLYKGSMKNLEAIKDRNLEVDQIPDESVKEFQEINEIFNDINDQYKGKIITSKEGDIENIPLEYFDDEKVLVSYDSLMNNIVDLIIVTKSFRNALVEIYYDLQAEDISENDEKRILNKIKEGLQYKNLLISKNKKQNGFIIYVPVFDSVSQLQEEIEGLFRHISIIKRTNEGRKIVAPKVAIVIYPYSSPENMVNDLAIAKRSDKTINVFLPSKENKANNSPLFENLNVNELAKISERLDLLDIDDVDGQKEINRALNDICNYFSFTSVGYAKLNKVKKQFLCEYSYSPEEKHLVLQEKPISAKFINKLVEVKDSDQSYYFSNRQHLNDSLAAFIDSHEIKSGLFYLVMKDGIAVGVIYYLNNDKEMEYDCSIKQGLINISNKIGNYIKSIDDQHIANINAKRFQEVLKLNNDILYSVNPDDYSLFFVSAALQSICPSAQIGEKCHKALYGSDTPCKACPLVTKKHMVEILKRRKFETSVVLHNSEDKAEHLYLKPMEKNKNTSDLFSPDFLINSYYSFCSYLEDEFALEHEGEILFLNIDNVPQLIKSLGNDGYIKAIRNFFDAIREEIDMNLTLYLYKNDNFALLFPSSSKEDVISLTESLYSLAKQNMVGSKQAALNISYYDFKYPESSKEYKLWINHAEKVMTGLRRGKKTDLIYFNEDKYTRSASREEFMLQNVLEAFKRKKYFMEYQPIVGNRDRVIHGAELLLRLNDPFTNAPLNIGEAINIVTKHNRIDLVAEAMTDCLEKLFQVADLPFFQSMGLEHLSVNVDYQTLSDKSFIESFDSLTKKHNVPKGFICFEVPESDIMDHYDEFRDLHFENEVLVCDQYHGELLRLDQLQAIGFKEVKMSRDVILNIINDDVALQRANDVWKFANEIGMFVTFVGVEKRQQADLLHDDVRDSNFQGRFFYSPMSEEKFFKTLRESSIKSIADLDN
ncbi:MAG: EAL domain-containing protein [Bacilli bacterium]|nr:EAL domain-containing protein [Bacilli bacterium]